MLDLLTRPSRIALVVGHQVSSPGAVNEEEKISEWEFNSILVDKIKGFCNVETEVFSPDVPHWSKSKIINDAHKKRPFAAAIEFHLNSAPKSVVNYSLAKTPKGNSESERLAILLLDAIDSTGLRRAKWGGEMVIDGVFPTGIAPKKTKENVAWFLENGWKYRGSPFLHKTIPPPVLLETFFLSCTTFLRKMKDQVEFDSLALNLANALEKFIE